MVLEGHVGSLVETPMLIEDRLRLLGDPGAVEAGRSIANVSSSKPISMMHSRCQRKGNSSSCQTSLITSHTRYLETVDRPSPDDRRHVPSARERVGWNFATACICSSLGWIIADLLRQLKTRKRRSRRTTKKRRKPAVAIGRNSDNEDCCATKRERIILEIQHQSTRCCRWT